jgi:hypothetical protein
VRNGGLDPRVEGCNAFQGCDIEQSLIRNDEEVNDVLAPEIDGRCQLESIEGSKAVQEAVFSDEASGPFEVISGQGYDVPVSSRNVEEQPRSEQSCRLF